MNVSYQDNIPAFNSALKAFLRFSRLAIPAGLRYQGRLLAERLIQFTPPIRRDKTPRSQGRAAVKRDIGYAIRPLKPTEFKSKAIRDLIRARKYEALEVVFHRMTNSDLAGARVVPFDPAWHRQAQRSRGHVTKYMRVLTPDADKVKEYTAKIQGHVGSAKGGWAGAVKHLGGTAAEWIMAHAGYAGRVIDQADDSLNPHITFINQSKWASQGDQDRIVANALRARARDITQAIAKGQAEALRKAKLTRR